VQRPEIPRELIRSQPPGGEATLTTVAAQGGGSEYRLLAKPLGEGTVVVAVPLTEVNATKRLLLLIGGAVSGFVLVAIGIAAYWLTRRELRPLERMAQKSRAIAAGDLTQRVGPDDPRTEVGQLGGALNAMLAEIERAFADRVAAEGRLRRFVADASHELRTPVTSIRGYAEMFRRGAGDRPADLANVMRRIEQEGERMAELVEELLLLARLDQGLPLEREPVDLSAVVDAAVDAGRAADPERPIEVDAQRPLLVLGSDTSLRQVVDNLLGNARVHTPAGTPIHVRLATEDKQVVLEVADEGPGVPVEEADRIFERFYRTDRSRTRSQGGAGLGLAIVRSLVEAHTGAVAYRPRPGGGSVFRIVLPLAVAGRSGDVRPATATASALSRRTPPLADESARGDPALHGPVRARFQLPSRQGRHTRGERCFLQSATKEDHVMNLIDRLFRRGRYEPGHGRHPGQGGHDQGQEQASREHEHHGGHAAHAGGGHGHQGGHHGGQHGGHGGHHH
jgi:two-component system OmpR family sensor kinase